MGFLLKRRKSLNALLSLKPRGLFFGQVLNNTSFLLPEQKKRNKENSPSALFVLLRHFSPLNKKNSLRSNSFLFFTLQHSPPLHAQKVRPDLSAFFTQHRFARWGCGVYFFCFALLLTIFFINFRPPWKSVKKFLHFSVKKKKLFERSEFFFFRKNVKILALERQPANFFVSFLLFVQRNEKPLRLEQERSVQAQRRLSKKPSGD